MKLTELKDRILFYFACLSLLVVQSCTQKTVEVSVVIDAEKVENTITPWLYGSCIEDVNHEIYGGLYDQKIFGESFEEPVPSPVFDDFSVYEGTWEAENQEVFVHAYSGAKLVYDPVEVNSGSVEAEIKFTGKNGDNAGFITRVTNAGKGSDHFFGYEISLSADGKKVVFGKHKNNFELVKNIDVNCNSTQWNKLKVNMENGKIEVFLNNQNIFTLEDNDPDLKNGKFGLRTWNSDTRFRQIKVSTGNLAETIQFKTMPGIPVSSQWDAIQTGDAKIAFVHDTKDAFNGVCSQIVEFISGNGKAGISNASLNRWGIAVKNGQQFNGRVYLKTSNLKGSVIVALQSADGNKEYAKQKIKSVTNQWEKYSFNLIANADDPNARFAIYFEEPGKLWIDQVTLMNVESEQFKGLPYRKDIGEMMVTQKLTYLRYGGSMVNAPEYRFKKMIGDPDRRPPYAGTWYRYSTNGFGIEDFLKFSEAAGFVPAFAINIEETPEDMADMIEYLNGSVTSVWGKKRAENGHPEPYHVKYIGIGNEEVLPDGDKVEAYDHYIERFNLLYDAMKSKDPSLSLINAAWWRPESPNMERVFKALDGKADYWDYHPWTDQLSSGKDVEKELNQMQDLFHKWNPDTKMKCAIYEENGVTHNMQRVLGHVTLQNAVRRMGDFVLTSCAANALQPYKQNDNGWDQGQIFFTPAQVWGMPPFYAQQMASDHHLPLRVFSSTDNDSLDITATRDKNGNKLVIHAANISNKGIAANLNINGFEKVKNVKAISITGKLEDINTPEEPERIIPKEKQLDNRQPLIYEFAPYSYTILVFSK